MKKKTIWKKLLLGMLLLVSVMFLALFVYSSNPYQPLDDMQLEINSLDTSNIVVNETSRQISYQVTDPIANILFIPGGLVNPHSYDYLMMKLALEGYQITIFKPFFDLAILTPNFASKYLEETLDNIIIGHSLGGVVASMIASKSDLISKVILMGSYPIQDISDKEVLLITAEFDIQMNQEEFDNSLQYVNDDYIQYEVIGGNHAQFGWYGPQKGDGEATITTLEQQNEVFLVILDFLNPNQ